MTACKIIGVACIFLAVYVAFDTYLKFLRCSRETEGKLVSLDVREEMDYSKRWRNYFVPVYSYEVKGKEYQGYGKEYRLKPNYDPSKPVVIKYNPLDPSEFIANKKTGNVYVCIFFLALGIIFLVLANH